MKLAAALVIALLFAACSMMKGGNDVCGDEARAGLERLKSLEGRWKGETQHDGQTVPIEFVYHVTAAGSAVEERMFAGTPHEMVTMYHLDGDHLMLTHYCAEGNQPHMIARCNPNMDLLKFTCSGGTNMQSENDEHMHSGQILFVDKDHIEETWSGLKGGKPAGDSHFELTRAS